MEEDEEEEDEEDEEEESRGKDNSTWQREGKRRRVVEAPCSPGKAEGHCEGESAAEGGRGREEDLRVRRGKAERRDTSTPLLTRVTVKYLTLLNIATC